MRTLYALGYSPWSEKARWALDHHRLAFREREHLPLLGEGLLRWRARKSKSKSKASVPLLIAGDQVIADSFEIVAYADRHGEGSRLITDASCAQINERCETALRAARARVVVRMLASPKSLDEASAALAPAILAPLLRPVARVGAKFLAQKHGAALSTADEHDQQMGEILAELSNRLGARNYLLGDFSAADICLAVTMQAVEPVAGGYIRIKSATRACWQSPELAREYAHLVEWRDAIYAKHR